MKLWIKYLSSYIPFMNQLLSFLYSLVESVEPTQNWVEIVVSLIYEYNNFLYRFNQTLKFRALPEFQRLTKMLQIWYCVAWMDKWFKIVEKTTMYLRAKVKVSFHIRASLLSYSYTDSTLCYVDIQHALSMLKCIYMSFIPLIFIHYLHTLKIRI